MVIDDYVVGISAAVTTASLIVLITLLARYRVLVGESGRSAQMAKNIWDAMNSRFSVTDARIVDLMAKVDVYSVRSTANSLPAFPSSVGSQRSQLTAAEAPAQDHGQVQSELRPAAPSHLLGQGSTPATTTMGEETEVQILRSLSEGPKTSTQIKEVIGRSREHTARLMKALFEDGLVIRNDRNKPYVYELTETGKNHLKGS